MKILSYFLISITSIGILYFSSWFFLGGFETYQSLKENLALNIAKRTIFFALPGVILFLILTVANRLDNKKELKKIGFIGMIICLISSFLGSLLFFTNGYGSFE